MPTAHSNIVGGSTAKRVINCPASVALCAEMPKQLSSSYADEGTLCHDVVADFLEKDVTPESQIGRTYMAQTLTRELLDEKVNPALDMLTVIDPDNEMDLAIESEVSFGDFLPGVFGSADVLGRIDRTNTAYVLDWKFGRGIVDAHENYQMLFYAAAAMRTPGLEWIFEGVDKIVMAICQPEQGEPSVWETTPARVAEFEKQLAYAVKLAGRRNAPMAQGEWCVWCTAKPTCPLVTGVVERAHRAKLEAIDVDQLAEYLSIAPVVESWIKDLYALAYQLADGGVKVPGHKLVAKRAMRKWDADPETVADQLEKLISTAKFEVNDDTPSAGMQAEILCNALYVEPTLVSPAQAEKVLKKAKLKLPADLVIAVSSGNTLVTEDDPRPEVLQLGQQLLKLTNSLK